MTGCQQAAAAGTACAPLGDVIAGATLVYPARRLTRNGLKAWAQVLERGYEGLVGKDDVSPDEGGPTARWLKVKQPG